MVKKKTSNREAPESHRLQVDMESEDNRKKIISDTIIRPSTQAAATLQGYSGEFGEVGIGELVSSLQDQIHATEKDDLGRMEAMLTTQAHTLDTLFNVLARKANNSEYLNQVDTYLKFALRAQSQCRATIEALSSIKNPPVMGYVNQANIAHGPQQVNNAAGQDDEAKPPQENETPENKLLEEQDGKRLDTRAQGQTIGSDS